MPDVFFIVLPQSSIPKWPPWISSFPRLFRDIPHIAGLIINPAKFKSAFFIENFEFVLCQQMSFGHRWVWIILPCVPPKWNLIFICKALQKFDQPGCATSSRLERLEFFDFNAIFSPIKQSNGLPKLPKFVFAKFLTVFTNTMHFLVRRCVGLPLIASTL